MLAVLGHRLTGMPCGCAQRSTVGWLQALFVCSMSGMPGEAFGCAHALRLWLGHAMHALGFEASQWSESQAAGVIVCCSGHGHASTTYMWLQASACLAGASRRMLTVFGMGLAISRVQRSGSSVLSSMHVVLATVSSLVWQPAVGPCAYQASGLHNAVLLMQWDSCRLPVSAEALFCLPAGACGQQAGCMQAVCRVACLTCALGAERQKPIATRRLGLRHLTP